MSSLFHLNCRKERILSILFVMFIFAGIMSVSAQTVEETVSEEISEKVNASVVNPTALGMNLVYTGEKQDLIIAGDSEQGQWMYKEENAKNWSDAVPQASNAGEYSVAVYFKGDEGHNDYGSEDNPYNVLTAVIEAVNIPEDAIIAPAGFEEGLSYTGSELPLAAAGKWVDGNAFGTFKYLLIETPSEPIDADNEEDAAADIEELQEETEIAEEIPAASAGEESDNAEETEEETVVVYSEEIPTAVLPGAYTISWMIEGDENHNDFIPEENLTANIADGELSAENIRFSPSSFEHDGLDKKVTVRVYFNGKELVEGEDYLLLEKSILEGKEIGSYDVTIQGMGYFNETEVTSSWYITEPKPISLFPMYSNNNTSTVSVPSFNN